MHNYYKQSCVKRGIHLSLTVRTDMPKNPGRKGSVPSAPRRASPKLPINERVKRSHPQNSIPNVNPFRLKQMNLRIKFVKDARDNFSHHQEQLQTHHLISVWPERSSGPTKTLKRDSRAGPQGNRMHIIIFGFRAFKQLSRHLCHVRIRWSFPTDCLSHSATKTTLQKSSV